MKKLLSILLFALFLILSCSKSDDKLDENLNENYIKLTSVTPKSGSVIREPLTIQAQVKYNIALNELEGMGFYISLWSSYSKNAKWYSSPDKEARLEIRNDEKLIPIEFVSDRFIKSHKGDSIFYRIAITKKTSEAVKYFLLESEPIFFVFD